MKTASKYDMEQALANYAQNVQNTPNVSYSTFPKFRDERGRMNAACARFGGVAAITCDDVLANLAIRGLARTSRDASGASVPGTEIYALTYVPIVGCRRQAAGAAGCAHAQTGCPSWRRPTAQPPTRLVCPFSNLICKQLRPKAAECARLLLVSGEPVNGDCANCCLALPSPA